MTASSLLEYGLASNVPHPGLGFRRCYRVEASFHGVEYLLCNCLRTELPIEARALSSGRLATPERNHICPACGGHGAIGADGIGLVRCSRCLGSGELTAGGAPGARP